MSFTFASAKMLEAEVVQLVMSLAEGVLLAVNSFLDGLTVMAMAVVVSSPFFDFSATRRQIRAFLTHLSLLQGMRWVKHMA